MQNDPIVIVGAARTPMGGFQGDFASLSASDLGADGPRVFWHAILPQVKPGLVAGISSVSPEAVRLCRENGITVIPGSCPNQFLKPDIGHGMMHGLWRLFGFLNVE